jgi:tRNA A37 threonylcarbamoyladenosine synthetase subunit TsaC/SUA5/YrdC
MDVTLPPPLTRVVPSEVVYQSIVYPLGTLALKVTVPVPQRALLLGLLGAAGKAFTVTAAPFDVTEQPTALRTATV